MLGIPRCSLNHEVLFEQIARRMKVALRVGEHASGIQRPSLLGLGSLLPCPGPCVCRRRVRAGNAPGQQLIAH